MRLCGGVERMVELISRSEDKSLAHIQPVLFDSLRYFRSTSGLVWARRIINSGLAVLLFIQLKQKELFCRWEAQIKFWKWFLLAIGPRSLSSHNFRSPFRSHFEFSSRLIWSLLQCIPVWSQKIEILEIYLVPFLVPLFRMFGPSECSISINY